MSGLEKVNGVGPWTPSRVWRGSKDGDQPVTQDSQRHGLNRRMGKW